MQLRQAGLTWHVVGDDVVVLDLTGSVYLKLNGSARLLWERLSEPCTEPELVAALVERFGIDDERAAADVAAFLADLRQRDLLAAEIVVNLTRLRRVLRRLGRLARTPPREILTMVHVVVVITVVEMLIRWVPLPRLSALLGVRVNLGPVVPEVEQLPVTELSPRARRQVRCTRRVADVWPFAAGPCLRRSLVVGHLLRDQRPALRLGVVGEGDRLMGHAWVEIEDRPLEGVDGYGVFQATPVQVP